MTGSRLIGTLAWAGVFALLAAPAAAGRLRPPQKIPSLNSVLSAGPIAPNGTLIRDGARQRTLEIDDLAPTHLRLTIPF